jgi:putative ABC transport system substrate-binding protein
MQTAARILGQQILVMRASSERDFEPGFLALVQQRAGALVVAADALFLSQRNQLIFLAAKHAIPTMYNLREYVVAGGLN